MDCVSYLTEWRDQLDASLRKGNLVHRPAEIEDLVYCLAGADDFARASLNEVATLRPLQRGTFLDYLLDLAVLSEEV